jgi:hypothetical protein
LKKIHLLICLMSLFILTSCTNKSMTTQGEWKTFSGNGIEFSYPSSWVSVNPNKIGIQPIPIALIYVNQDNGGFKDNLNLMIQESPFLAPSAEEQANQTESWFKLYSQTSGVKDYRKEGFTPKNIGDVKAGILTGEYTISQNDIRVKSAQFIVPYGQKTFILTFTCKIDDWESYQPTFNKIVDSFKLTQR